MGNEIVKKSICLDLSIADDGFGFSTSITDALAQAEFELAALNETIDSIHNLKPDCDRMDYILAASSGALCSIIDIFLVNEPNESPLGDMADRWFAARTMDFAKLCGANPDSLDSALRCLEKKFKVPYDQNGLGDAGRDVFDLTPRNHHFKSLAHNPSLLGLFFSILDQFSNTSHFVTDGQLVSLQQADKTWKLQGDNFPSKLFCGLVNWIGHLISDVSGSSSTKGGNRGMGIPSPLWAWVNDIIVLKEKLGVSADDVGKSINELALNIYQRGYDARFQTAQTIPVLVNELLVRLIYAIRRLFKYFSETPKAERTIARMWKKCEPFSDATIKRMLTVAHGTFCLVDLGDAAGRAFVEGGGLFNTEEFVLRLNIVGIGRFAISLYGEIGRTLSYYHDQEESDFVRKEIGIVTDYMESLKVLAHQYDDGYLRTFVDDFERSAAYTETFAKSKALAELRNVPANRILKNKSEIDKYFGGK